MRRAHKLPMLRKCAQRDVVLSGFKLAHHSVPSLSTLLSTNASLLASMGRFGFEPGFAGPIDVAVGHVRGRAERPLIS